MADINSLTAALSLGIQSAKGTQATKFNTFLATLSGLGTAFDKRQSLQEHPSSSGSVSYETATAASRTGYLGRARGTFLLRPKAIGQALIAVGFKVVTAAGPESGTYEHTFTIENDSLIKWMSVIHNIGDGGASFDRLLLDTRAERLNFNISNERIQCEIALKSLGVGIPSGSPTYTSEVDDEISPSTGSTTCTFDATDLFTEYRGATCEIAQGLKDQANDRPLHTSQRTDLARNTIGITGVLQGINVTEDLWWSVTGGDAAATAPTLITPTGALSFAYESADVIGATSTPYSMSWTFEKVELEFPEDGFTAQNADAVRTDINYTMLTNGVTTPIEIVLINDQAQYVA